MIEVVIFSEYGSGYLSECVEKFINYGEAKKIHDIKFSTTLVPPSSVKFSAMIIYEKLEVGNE